MAYDLSNIKVKQGDNWNSPNEIHKIANNYYLYAPIGATGGLVIKDGIPYYCTISQWVNDTPTIILRGSLADGYTNISRNGLTFTATQLDGSTETFTQQDDNTTYPEAIKNITRSGTTFTATRYNNSTFTFTQQDNNSLTGVKGNAESSYRTGNVNLTPANIGALSWNDISFNGPQHVQFLSWNTGFQIGVFSDKNMKNGYIITIQAGGLVLYQVVNGANTALKTWK